MQIETTISPKALPLQQAKLLRYVAETHQTLRVPPSQTDMARYLGVRNVQNYLTPLIKKGYLARVPGGPKGRSRGVVTTGKGDDWVEAVKDQALLSLRSRFVQFKPDGLRGPKQRVLFRAPKVEAGTVEADEDSVARLRPSESDQSAHPSLPLEEGALRS